MSTLFTFVASTVGKYAIFALVCFVAGGWVVWRLCHRVPRRAMETVEVTAALNGATLEGRAGLLGRKSRLVHLSGVSAPGTADLCGPESAANLWRISGTRVRVESTDNTRLGRGDLVGTVFGESGQDLALAQLRAGFCACESHAQKTYLAAQAVAKAARAGIWRQKADGSHWWHFGVGCEAADLTDLPRKGNSSMFTLAHLGLALEILAAVVLMAWLVSYFFGAGIVAKFPAAAYLGEAIDVSGQVAAYVALTGIRHVPIVSGNSQAVAACELLRGIVTQWPGTGAASGTQAGTGTASGVPSVTAATSAHLVPMAVA